MKHVQAWRMEPDRLGKRKALPLLPLVVCVETVVCVLVMVVSACCSLEKEKEKRRRRKEPPI